MLEVLDTAGQEEYSAMREQYMKNCEGILIVYSITSRSSFEEVRVFYNQILRVRDSVFEDDGEVFPLCIVGNKCDLEGERQVSTAEGFALAKEFCCDFIETSAKSRINVDQCFYDLVRLIRTRRALKSIEIPGGYRGSLGLTIDLDWLFRRQKPGVLSQNLPIQEYVALTRQLVQAAKVNDKRAVKKLLMKGADPDGYSESNGSAIYAAAAAGHANIVGLLLSRGAAVNARGPRGVTPLQVAAVEGHHEIVRVLLSKNVPVDEMSRMYGTALLGAASRVRLDVVRVLLEHGADVNATGGYEPYKKALHAAAVIGSIELAKLLLRSGAEINARAPNGYTALETACHHGKAEIVRLLLERGAQPNLRSKKYGFELKIANDRGHYNVVKLLLDFGASDELVRDAARMPIQSTTTSPQDIGQNGIGRAAEDSVSVNWPLPAAPLPTVSQIPDSATEPPSQITSYNSNERQQSSISPAVNPPTARGNKHVIPEVRSSSVSRTWKFWKSKSDLVIQNGKGSPEVMAKKPGIS
jgi:small GTP-binding protein